jgi:hypothetical protein
MSFHHDPCPKEVKQNKKNRDRNTVIGKWHCENQNQTNAYIESKPLYSTDNEASGINIIDVHVTALYPYHGKSIYKADA